MISYNMSKEVMGYVCNIVTDGGGAGAEMLVFTPFLYFLIYPVEHLNERDTIKTVWASMTV